MKCVILAAGKGTRFGRLTEKTPKSLILIAGKPILQYTLESLPSSVTEVFLVIGHLGDRIRKRVGNSFGKIPIRYVELERLNGTAGAVWAVKRYLKDRFLVLNGDDIYSKADLKKLIALSTSLRASWAFGLYKMTPPHLKYLTIRLDKNINIVGATYPENIQDKILLATGAYILDKRIFKYKPVPIGNAGELGLPQTILKAAKKISVKGVIMNHWIQINYPNDISKAEEKLSL